MPTWIGEVAERGAVHLEKGCYRGQETVSRVHNLGRSPRVLIRLHLDGSAGDDQVATGAEVRSGGRPVGRVGTVVQHHEYGPVALALLSAPSPDAELESTGPPRSTPTPTPGVRPQAGREAVKRLRGQT